MSNKYSRSSTRLMYDNCAAKDYVRKSVSPGKYNLDPSRIYNKKKVRHGVGVVGTYGVSHPELDSVAPKQALIDIDSFLSNRNIPASDCPKNGANMGRVNFNKFKHAEVPDIADDLVPTNSLLDVPKAQMRGMAIDRFHYLHRDLQSHIFYDFSRNTTLEAKDNYEPETDTPMNQSEFQPKGGKINPKRGCYAKKVRISPPGAK